MPRRIRQRGGRSSKLVRSSAKLTDFLVSSLSPSFWFRADNVAGTTSAVTKIYNKVLGATDYLTVNGTLAMSGSNPAFNGKPTLSFEGTQYADSNLSPANWRLLSNGGPTWVVSIHSHRSLAGTQTIWSTWPGNATAGTWHYGNLSGAPYFAVASGSGANIGNTGVLSGNTAGVPIVTQLICDVSGSPDLRVFVNGTQAYSGNLTQPPDQGNPGQTLSVGRLSAAGNYFNGNLADLLIFDRIPTAADLQTIAEYRTRRYG